MNMNMNMPSNLTHVLDSLVGSNLFIQDGGQVELGGAECRQVVAVRSDESDAMEFAS